MDCWRFQVVQPALPMSLLGGYILLAK